MIKMILRLFKKDLLLFLFVAVLVAITLVYAMRSGRGRQRGVNELGRSFEFDMERFLRVDPALIVCDETAAYPVALPDVLDMTVGPDDRIYMVNAGRVAVLEADGTPAGGFDVQGAVRCIAVDSNAVYLGVDDHIRQYGFDGVLKEEWRSPARGVVPGGILVTEDFVYLTDAANMSLYQFDRSGNVLRQAGGFTLFSIPRIPVALAPDGSLWAANPGARGLRQYNEELEMTAAWERIGRGIDGFSGCCNPSALAMRPDGTLVVSEKNIVRIKLMDQSGKVTGVVAAPEKFNQQINYIALAVDSRNRILALDPHLRQVRVFEDRKAVDDEQPE